MKLHRTIIILITMLLPLFSCSRRLETNTVTGQEGQPLPDFALQLPDSVNFYHTTDMKQGHQSVFFYFGPDCPHCKDQLQEIKANMNDLQEVQFVLLTGESFNGMKRFYQENKLSEYPNVITGRDTANFFGKHYQVTAYPFLAFYNKKKLLRMAFSGRMTIEKFMSTVN